MFSGTDVTDIFFSYASGDRERIAPLVEIFENEGWSVWWDRHIVPGTSYDDMIEQAITGAACIVVAWTKESVVSDWVRHEALFGHDNDILIPVLLDDVELPFAFRRMQAAMLIGWTHKDKIHDEGLDRLLKGIHNTLKTIPTSSNSPPLIAEERPSFAVLPFDDISNDPILTDLAEGMTEDIITYLAQNPTFFVTARNSSSQFKGGASDIREVGRKLGVRYVLEGSIRKVGNKVRVVGQLIETETGGHIWTDTYNEPIETIDDTQDVLIQQISNAVASAAGTDNFQRILHTPRDQLGPWGLLSLAAACPTANREGRTRRQNLIRGAIALDPSSGVAHVRLADVLAQDYIAGFSNDPVTDRKQALAETEAALRLAPGDAAVVAIASTTYMNIGELRRSISLARRALALAPISPSYVTLANVLLRAGKAEEAITIYKELTEKAPKYLGPNHTGLAMAYGILGDYEMSLFHAEEWELWSPGSYAACLVQANALVLLDEMEAANDVLLKIQDTLPGFRLEEGIASLEKGQGTALAKERITAGLLLILKTNQAEG